MFCDGSARPVDSPPYVLTYEASPDPREVGPNFNLISRWSVGKFDTYPTPGALIWGSPPHNTQYWPFRDYQNNFGDPAPWHGAGHGDLRSEGPPEP